MRLIDANALLLELQRNREAYTHGGEVAELVVRQLVNAAPTQDFNELLEHCAKLCENQWDVDSAAADIRKLKQ